MSKTYIIDGNSLLFRSFYATYRPGVEIMRAQDGTPTNALFTFYPMLEHIKNSLTAEDRMIVCFDTGHPTFRTKEIEGYKAQRKPIEPDLKKQIPLAHEMCKCMGIETAEMEGYEGDDVAGSLAKYAARQGDEVVLFTSDKDFLQLIDDHIQVHALKRGLSDVFTYTKENMVESYGVRADQVTDFKAIAGDASDNYKGIPHIGEKTAKSLLSKYNHLEDILTAYRGKSDTALARNLNAGADEGRLCLKIATIVTDLDVAEFYNRGAVRPENTQAVLAFMNRFSLEKYARQISNEAVKEDEKGTKSAKLDVTNADVKAENIPDIAPDCLPIAVSAILSSENENTADILGFAIGYRDRTVKLIDSFHMSSATNLKRFLADPTAEKWSLDSKSTIVAAHRLGFEACGFTFDFLLASYLINSDRAATLEDAFSQIDIILPPDPTQRYVNATAAMIESCASLLASLKKQDAEKLLTTVEIPLAKTLADMEIEGLPLDLKELARIGTEYRKLLKDLEQQIYQLAGTEFNIKSPMQVADILFNRLGLPKGKKESGTSIEVLNNHYADHPIIPLIIQYRTYAKIISGYIDALPKHVLSDGKIHAKINQTLTSTGRLSCSEPNLQNISIRKEEGKEIRKAFFYPDDDFEFLSLDYSQVELRVLASLGNIKNLIAVCNSGEDIHKATASMVFNVPIDEVTPEMRRKAKTVNFGIVYGISTYGLKERLGISFEEAKLIISAFKKTFEGMDEYESKVKDFARKNGYVKTILNRRRYFPDINSSNPMKRAFSERAAINATIQGSAADLIKVAMIKVSELLKGKRTKIVVQIHDELVFKMAKDEEKELIPLIAKTMDEALPLSVKQTVEGSTGHSWFDCK